MASFWQEKNLYNTIYLELKALGVKVPKPKKIRSNASKIDVFVTEKGCKIFGASLREQEWISNGEYPIPKFVAMTTEYLQKFTQNEGLFRKGGNVQRQRKLKSLIEKGGDVQESDPNDVAALLKQWLRELPEPLIPAHLQDLFIRCHGLEEATNRETAYLFAFLLLPIDHQNTLKHLLRFFANIARDSDKNRMGTDNLALILAPNLFAWKEPDDKVRNNLILQHKDIIQVLIENSEKVGMIPQSVLYQSNLLGSDLTASVDVLDMGPGKYKKRMSETVQDFVSGFRRLVGQNISFKASSVSDLAEATVSRPSSLDDLDDNYFVTPEKKVRTIPEKSSSRHTRRKSFGALFLRRKEKKSHKSGTQNLQMKVVDIALDTNGTEQNASNSANFGSKCQLNLNFTHSFPVGESSTAVTKTVEEPTAKPVAPTRSDSVTMVKKNESIKWAVENAAESFKASSSVESKTLGRTSKVEKLKMSNSMKSSSSASKLENLQTSSSIESTSRGKTSKIEMASTHKSGLSRQEAFSIRSSKCKSQISVSDHQNSENDLKLDNVNEKEKNDTAFNTENGTCMHSNTTCNLKCGKNKSVCEKKTAQGKAKREIISKRRPQSLKMPRPNEFSTKEPSRSSRVRSHQNLAGICSPPLKPSLNPIDEASASSVSQSLDLSLNLLLQNFCLSPPLDAPEFRLSIDISSDKKNSELKVNISQKETPSEKEHSNDSSKNDASDSKPRKRLSSNSDSRIPRLKKTLNPNRPSSFHGNLTTSRHGHQKVNLNEKPYGRHSTKIPTLQTEEMSPSTPKGRLVQDTQSPSDSIFKTPNTTFSNDFSNSWVNGSHYLSALTSPDDTMANKRESIVKILKYNPGHVLSKVSMFDSKGSSGSESDYKLTRTSSEKYSSVSRCTRPKLTVSNSYNGVSRSDSVRNGVTPRKPERPIPRKVSFRARNTPKPLSKRVLSKCAEDNSVSEEIAGEHSEIDESKGQK